VSSRKTSFAKSRGILPTKRMWDGRFGAAWCVTAVEVLVEEAMVLLWRFVLYWFLNKDSEKVMHNPSRLIHKYVRLERR
jgi:hypothetical protein